MLQENGKISAQWEELHSLTDFDTDSQIIIFPKGENGFSHQSFQLKLGSGTNFEGGFMTSTRLWFGYAIEMRGRSTSPPVLLNEAFEKTSPNCTISTPIVVTSSDC